MLLGNGGSSPRDARAINLDNQQKTYHDQMNGSGSTFHRFNLKQRSRFDLSVFSSETGTSVSLIKDKNNNNRVDRGELVKRSNASDTLNNILKFGSLGRGNYFIQVSTNQTGDVSYHLATSAKSLAGKRETWAATGNGATNNDGFQFLRNNDRIPRVIGDRPNSGGGNGGGSSGGGSRPSNPKLRPTNGTISTQNWNGRFINRTDADVANFRTYDFSNPDAIADMGSQGRRGNTAAQLNFKFGNDSPIQGVNQNQFALEAWTRVNLEDGYFYQVSSDSDDGTRFFFKDANTGKVVGQLEGDWRDRTTRKPTWTQVVTAPEAGNYDFYVQYYDKAGKATIDVDLEKVSLRGKVTTSSGLNLRKQPTTSGSSPSTLLKKGSTVEIIRQVKSTDSRYPTWYEVKTRRGERGYVAADSGLIEVTGRSKVVALGGLDDVSNPNNNTPPPPPPPSGSGSSLPGSAFIRSSVSFRSDSSTSAGVISTLSANTQVQILDKVSGSSYGDGVYNQWYKVRVNGQEGYVAAFYVEPTKVEGRFPTAIAGSNNYFREHLNEAVDPYYYSGPTYKSTIEKVVSAHNSDSYYSWLKPSLVGAIGSRESGWGLLLNPYGPGGTGDYGYGRGLMQIDSEAHPTFISRGTWVNPEDNIRYGVEEVLMGNYEYLDRNTNLEGMELLRAAIASYNAGVGNVMAAIEDGLDVDGYTTGKDYSWDVINRAGWFQENGWA